MRTIVAATHNKGKIREFERILSPLGIEVLPMPDPAILAGVEETGETFEQNALLKARAVFAACGLPTVADDSGLCVTALGNRPGVRSARYLGEDTPYDQKIAGLLRELDESGSVDRAAAFVCAVALVTARGAQTFLGRCEGTLGYEPRGQNGFGYDPIFYREGRSLAECSDEEKDAVSHRAHALAALACHIDELL